MAYASEEILRVLILAGVGALNLASPIGIAIALVIAIVIYSYRQTIVAYPQGASDYIVARTTSARWPASPPAAPS